MSPGEVSPSNPFLALTIQWLETWQRASALGREDLREISLFWNPRELRSRWLADLSQALDSYMRSPAFLELMQHNLNAMTRAAGLTSLPAPK